MDGHLRDAAVLISLGVDTLGNRQILGVSVSLSEAEFQVNQEVRRRTRVPPVSQGGVLPATGFCRPNGYQR